MQIGTMNHPGRDVLMEIRRAAELGMEFVDLTLEPPAAASWKVDPHAIRGTLSECGLGVVGHTAYYLPMGSSIEGLRRAAVAELKRSLEVFAVVGVKWMNLHPDGYAPFHQRDFSIQRNMESLNELLEDSRRLGVGLMIENLPGPFNTPEDLGDLLEPLPELALHLDIGHANLRVPHSTAASIIRVYGQRLRHVHIHDNRGGRLDLHLPLGVGTSDLWEPLRALKAAGYDGTITLEVFSEEKRYVTLSRDLLREMWAQA